MTKKYLLTLSACSLIALSACSQMAASPDTQAMNSASGMKADSSEALLAAEGSWNLVEEQGATAPLDLHSSAKKQVNPNNRQKKTFIPPSQMANVAGTNGDQDIKFRLLRMELEMQDLRQDFDSLLPPLSTLAEANSPLDNTIQKIMAKPRKKPMEQAEASKSMQKMAKAQTPNAAPAPQKASKPSVSGAAVKNIRFGEHPGKTRMVLDLTGAATYSANVDNTQKQLLIELTGADWATAQEKLIKHPLVAGYSTKTSANGGTTLALDLKKPVKILGSAALKPNSSRGHRIYLDLASG